MRQTALVTSLRRMTLMPSSLRARVTRATPSRMTSLTRIFVALPGVRITSVLLAVRSVKALAAYILAMIRSGSRSLRRSVLLYRVTMKLVLVRRRRRTWTLARDLLTSSLIRMTYSNIFASGLYGKIFLLESRLLSRLTTVR